MLKPLQYLYLAIAIIHLFAIATVSDLIALVSKPLLMIVLILFYAQSVSSQWSTLHKLMVVAFFFSWIGDVALMFVAVNENFFLLGLVGFLIAHILYSVAFSKVTKPHVKSLLPTKFWVLIPLAVYMAALISVLVPAISGNPATQPFLIPVMVYSAAIASMVVFAVNRYKRVADNSFALVLGGALLFMFSDSIIAINKFVQPFNMATIFIMLLYISGQYLIAQGMLKQNPILPK